MPDLNEAEIRELIETEFREKNLGVTEQYLEIHDPVYEDGVLKIDRIDEEWAEDTIVAYLPVKDQYFHFAVYIDINAKSIRNLGTESGNVVSLIATSEASTSKKLLSFIKLKPTKVWDKGDLRPCGKRFYKVSGIEFLPNPEPDEFEDKIRNLLSFLQADSEGVIALAKNADARVRVIMDFHRGNQILGGATLDLDIIKNLADLNLPVDLELNAWGNPFK